MSRLAVLSVILATGAYSVGASDRVRVPRIWDDAALAEWATPVAGVNVRPAHYSSAEYYASPADNYRTYPVYQPGREPAGYWAWLHEQRPQPLVDAAEIRTKQDWITAGERAFRDMDLALVRSSDPALIARARDAESLQQVATNPDGSVPFLRWVVTPGGVMLTAPACSACHASIRREGVRLLRRPGDDASASRPRRAAPLTGPAGTARRLQLFYSGDPATVAFWREFTTPWAPDERVERFKTMPPEQLTAVTGPEQLGRSFGGGMFARANGSPYYATKIPDLHHVRYSRYLDATATHRLRGPEDIARYAALVTGADRMDFGPYRILTDQQRRMRFHYADEVLYAIGVYLMALELPQNPDRGSPETIVRGERIFRREGCAACHRPPAYTSGKLVAAPGYRPPSSHPNRVDIIDRVVGTDAGAALNTRKGTGLYKIPSLRGVWFRRLLLHDGSLTSLEELFDRRRLDVDYEPQGWNPPGVDRRAVPGHSFGLSLSADEKRALITFLRSL